MTIINRIRLAVAKTICPIKTPAVKIIGCQIEQPEVKTIDLTISAVAKTGKVPLVRLGQGSFTRDYSPE